MTDLHLLYIIGEPGSGKSTLTRALVAGRRRRINPKPFMHTVYAGGLVQLGRERATFSGTDALSLSVGPLAVQAVREHRWKRILGEGDRLAYPGFFQAAGEAGYDVDVVHLQVSPETAAFRRTERGSNQDEKWLAGRRTKVANLSRFVTITLNGERPVEELAAELRNHPALENNATH